MKYAPALACLALLFAGCAATPVATVSRPQLAAAGAPACASCQPQAALAASSDVGPAYAYGIGPDDHVRSALVIPADVAICLIGGIKCALNALVPTPVATLHPVTIAAPKAAAAAPCVVAAPLPAACK